jgi:hypothetical protein
MAANIQTAIANLGAANDQSIVAAVPSRTIRVVGLTLSCGAAASTVFFESGTSTAISPVFALPINGTITLPLADSMWGYFATAQHAALTASQVGAGPVGYLVNYVVL